MSLFSKILDKLGLKKDTSESTSAPSTRTAPPASTQTAEKPGGSRQPAKPSSAPPQVNKPSMPGSRPGAVANPAASSPATPSAAQADRAAAPTPVSEVDVVKKLEQLSAGKGLNWKTSIVDLLKLLDLDSSREARTELAKELNAPAEVMTDSARMNTWLHKEVLRRIAQNGGNIPRELLD